MAKETAARLDLSDDFTYPFTILNGAETLAVDITGWALSWMVKRRKSDPGRRGGAHEDHGERHRHLGDVRQRRSRPTRKSPR